MKLRGKSGPHPSAWVVCQWCGKSWPGSAVKWWDGAPECRASLACGKRMQRQKRPRVSP